MKKKIKKIIFVAPTVLAVALLLAISLTTMGCAEEEGAEKVGTISETKDEKSEENAKTKDSSSEEETNDGRYYPGDIIKKSDFKITYKKASNYKSSNQFIEPSKGKKFVRFQFSFKNLSDTDQYVGSFECYYKDNKCEEAYVADDDDSNFLLESLSKGRSVSGSVYYEVPKKAKLSQLELEYTSDLWSNEKVIFMGAK